LLARSQLPAFSAFDLCSRRMDSFPGPSHKAQLKMALTKKASSKRVPDKVLSLRDVLADDIKGGDVFSLQRTIAQETTPLPISPGEAHELLLLALRESQIECLTALLPACPHRLVPPNPSLADFEGIAKSSQNGPAIPFLALAVHQSAQSRTLLALASDPKLRASFSDQEWLDAIEAATHLCQEDSDVTALRQMAAALPSNMFTERQWGLVAFQAIVDNQLDMLEKARKHCDLSKVNNQSVGLRPASEGDMVYGLLKIAVDAEEEKMVELLLDCGCDANARDPQGRTLLMEALASRQLEISKMLLPNSDLGLVDTDGASVLMHAVGANDPGFLEELLRAGANANAVDHNGWTALMHAVNANVDTMDSIVALASVTDPAIQANGETVLDMSLAKGLWWAVDALTANLDAKAADGAMRKIMEALAPRAAKAAAAHQEALFLRAAIEHATPGAPAEDLSPTGKKASRRM